MDLYSISKMWLWAESHQNKVFPQRCKQAFCLPLTSRETQFWNCRKTVSKKSELFFFKIDIYETRWTLLSGCRGRSCGAAPGTPWDGGEVDCSTAVMDRQEALDVNLRAGRRLQTIQRWCDDIMVGSSQGLLVTTRLILEELYRGKKTSRAI